MVKQDLLADMSIDNKQTLLRALAEDLLLPFVQLKTGLELLETSDHSKPNSLVISRLESSVEAGLRLLQSYQLALDGGADQAYLELEPYAIGAILQDCAHALTPYAEQYSTDIEVHVTVKARPVLVDKRLVLAAFHCLGSSFIRAQATSEVKRRNILVLNAHRLNSQQMLSGVYGRMSGLSNQSLSLARKLQGKAKQPFASVSANAASGILLADSLLAGMQSPLQASVHESYNGLAAAFPISNQITLL